MGARPDPQAVQARGHRLKPGALGAALWQIVVVCLLAAVASDQAGYWLGSRYGRAALVVGRFVPIVRTCVPFAAGAARMRYRRFATWNVLGALAWVGAMTGVGLLLAGVPGIADSIEGVVLAVIAASPARPHEARERGGRGLT